MSLKIDERSDGDVTILDLKGKILMDCGLFEKVNGDYGDPKRWAPQTLESVEANPPSSVDDRANQDVRNRRERRSCDPEFLKRIFY
jgi:hypothetical protein